MVVLVLAQSLDAVAPTRVQTTVRVLVLVPVRHRSVLLVSKALALDKVSPYLRVPLQVSKALVSVQVV